MVSVNLAVNHKSFGKGVIVSLSGKYITVKFASSQKIFVYPDAFESFLTLEDGSVSGEILADIAAAKAAKQAIIDQKKEENIRAMTKGIVIPGKDGSLIDPDDEIRNKNTTESDDVL